jgi:Zn-dependent protease with chaperone function
VLHRLGARDPNPRDLEERQLGNVVHEMAIAAGVQPPRVMIVDSEAVNAAAAGLGVDDATIVVTRGLLDTLDRDQTQAVLAHVVGSIGNGDLRIASTIFSIYQTWGALILLLQLPLGPRSRKAVWRALRATLRGGDRAVDRWEAEFVSEAFLRGSVADDDDLGDALAPRQPVGRIRAALQWPFVVTLGLGSLVVKFAVFVSSLLLIGPIVSFMWRARRYLADAMAVQLTRNPTALGTALDAMARRPTAVAGADAASFLFVMWSGGTASKDAVVGQFTGMHPKVHRRYARLRALGGRLAEPGKRRIHPKTLLLGSLLTLVVGPLMAVAFGGMIVLVVMLTMVTMMTMMVFLLATWGISKFLFMTLPAWLASR